MTSIIALIFSTPEIGALDRGVLDSELTTLSDNEVLVCDSANPEGKVDSMGISQEITRCGIREMTKDSRKQAAKL